MGDSFEEDENNILLENHASSSTSNSLSLGALHGSNDNEQRRWVAGEPAELVWNHISYTVRGKKILQDISGRAKGQMVAIMGSSGAGKTTLLHILSARARGGKKSGTVLLNGEKVSKNLMKQLGGYVWQDDLFFSHLTVRETLEFAADMTMSGTGASSGDKKKAVNDMMDLLGLKKCANNIVGDDFHKGISGGERKRLSIGVELLARPHLLFLDEPTSGLDSSTAHSVMDTLKTLTSSCTVICTIHQPSARIFEKFDLLCVLSLGQVVYFGPPEEAMHFYRMNGHEPKPFTNPADFVIDTISPDPIDKQAAQQALDVRQQLVESYGQQIQQLEEKMHDDDEGEKKKKKKEVLYPAEIIGPSKNRKGYRKRLNFFWQMLLLLSRTGMNYYRDWEVMLVQLIQNVGAAVLIGLVFLDLPLDQTGISRRFASAFFISINQGVYAAYAALTSFPMERAIVLRERRAGMYQTLPYFLAKSIVELPMQIFYPLLFTNIIYWLLNYEITFYKYAHFLILVELCSLTAISLGLFCASISPRLAVATIITPMILEIFRLFGGFFNTPVRLPNWLIWIQGFSFVTYTFTGIAQNEMRGRKFYCLPTQLVGGVCPTTTGEIAVEKFGLWDLDPYQCELVLIGMIIIYRVLAYICVRFNKTATI